MTRLILSAATAIALSLPLTVSAQSQLLGEFNTQRLEQTMGFDAELRQIAFGFLQGKTKSEAHDFLVAERFRCLEGVCERVIVDKESSNEAGSVFSKRRTTRATFAITLLADVIRSPRDIQANFRYETGEVPWHRRPKDSDFTVLYD
ncbi:hypothetical protein J7426_08625 [Tropicibacter sp. R16_0]|uniref:hypothetical protein n=1 Tax=Tropicibacter sp. R16_0 TaxID=2821102 RepID=UPI001ADC04C4|nr:hypothetical protein [Tropicibacter sp. R16_0]MBO9450315.1 hypothetical protein [Tropicibacter sp. R16_0]